VWVGIFLEPLYPRRLPENCHSTAVKTIPVDSCIIDDELTACDEQAFLIFTRFTSDVATTSYGCGHLISCT
jgi:hypothetical protein